MELCTQEEEFRKSESILKKKELILPVNFGHLLKTMLRYIRDNAQYALEQKYNNTKKCLQ